MTFLFFFILLILPGEDIFQNSCMVCHPNQTNLIIPEKNLEKKFLKVNGLDSLTSISYQIQNGKNGMPSFRDKLTKEQIKNISEYLLFDFSHILKDN